MNIMTIRWRKLFIVGMLLFIGTLSQNIFATEKDIVTEQGQTIHKIDM